MSADFDSEIEAAMIIAIADPKCVADKPPASDVQRWAFRLGFLAGVRFGLTTAMKEVKEIREGL